MRFVWLILFLLSLYFIAYVLHILSIDTWYHLPTVMISIMPVVGLFCKTFDAFYEHYKNKKN